jgi:hypothetical protein
MSADLLKAMVQQAFAWLSDKYGGKPMIAFALHMVEALLLQAIDSGLGDHLKAKGYLKGE